MELKMRPSELKEVEIARLMGELAEARLENIKLSAQLKAIQIQVLQAQLNNVPKQIEEQDLAIEQGKKRHERVMQGLVSRLEIDPSKYEVDTETGILTPMEE